MPYKITYIVVTRPTQRTAQPDSIDAFCAELKKVEKRGQSWEILSAEDPNGNQLDVGKLTLICAAITKR